MRHQYPIYNSVEDWQILDEKIIYDFDDNPIAIVNVLIGLLKNEYIGLNNQYETHTTNITRWITKKQYNHFLENKGVIVW